MSAVQPLPDFKLDEIEKLEAACLPLKQVDCPLVHRFAPGVYMREILMPAGLFIIGQQHKTEHWNIVLTGRATVLIDGVRHEIAAPAVIKSSPGVRKVLLIHEDMRWLTVHPTEETNVEKLEAALIVKSPAFLERALKDAETLKQAILEKENPCHL